MLYRNVNNLGILKMKHFELSDKTMVKSLKQVGELFPDYHATEAKAIKDLKLLKEAIKENTAYDWFRLNINLKTDATSHSINTKNTIKTVTDLCERLKLSESETAVQVEKCYKTTINIKKVSLK